MNISQAAKQCGLNPQTIRYYEQIDLITPARRKDNGYRDYLAKDLAELGFVHRARETGFSIEECRQLLELYRNPGRKSQHVHSLVLEKTKHVAAQIKRLENMHEELQELAKSCRDDNTPHCAILESLADQHLTAAEKSK